MPTSKHQRSLSTLRHRQREAYADAANQAMNVIRDRGEDHETWLDAVKAVATFDAMTDALNLAEATDPRPLRGNGHKRANSRTG